MKSLLPSAAHLLHCKK